MFDRASSSDGGAGLTTAEGLPHPPPEPIVGPPSLLAFNFSSALIAAISLDDGFSPSGPPVPVDADLAAANENVLGTVRVGCDVARFPGDLLVGAGTAVDGLTVDVNEGGGSEPMAGKSSGAARAIVNRTLGLRLTCRSGSTSDMGSTEGVLLFDRAGGRPSPSVETFGADDTKVSRGAV